MTETVDHHSARAAALALLAPCGYCWAPPGVPRTAGGQHLARYLRAERRGLLDRQALGPGDRAPRGHRRTRHRPGRGPVSAELEARCTAAAAVLADYWAALASAPLGSPPGREWMLRLADALGGLLDGLSQDEAARLFHKAPARSNQDVRSPYRVGVREG
jgi:hypothetical protein